MILLVAGVFLYGLRGGAEAQAFARRVGEWFGPVFGALSTVVVTYFAVGA